MYLLSTATVDASVVYFYPRLLPLSDVDPQVRPEKKIYMLPNSHYRVMFHG